MDRLRPSRGLALWLLSLALLHGQGLGQWHRVAHGGHSHVEHAQPSHAHQGHGHAQPARAVVQGPDLFGHDTGDAAECRLFDEISFAESLPSAPLVCGAPAMRGTAAPVLVAQREGRLLRPYQARAPPQG